MNSKSYLNHYQKGKTPHYFLSQVQTYQLEKYFFRNTQERTWASQVALVVKNPPANAGNIRDAGLIPGWGRSPGIEQSNLFQYSCLENSIHGQRSLESYSPQGHKESDTTEVTQQADKSINRLEVSILFTAICKASSDSHFASLHCFFWGWS